MLSVSIHASAPAEANRYNRLARLDIAYSQLAPIADYKVYLLERNQDVLPPRMLKQYPRWSSSLWDLVARAIAISLPENPPETESVPEYVATAPRGAFIREMCAILEHSASDTKNILGEVHLKQVGRTRCNYSASFDEHTMKRQQTAVFRFSPEYLRPAELLLHACLVRLTGTDELPARPGLCAPPPLEVDGKRYIRIDQLVESARTGFRTWLNWFSEPAYPHPDAPLGIAPEPIYTKFLCTAI